MKEILEEFAIAIQEAEEWQADQQAAEDAAYWDYIEQEDLNQMSQYQSERELEEAQESSRNS